ncbi:hypothetical protein BOX15_Mlig025937g2 [Macrostomum lignano]|uniref:TLC domain-containing protein n=1 Tax=Macrostomum lignano TaxID=282301 RepID=A0A267EN70_9PLAT|nr:hypothetical protein BOX15_Mlig025937g2 [Macrostomum lignano]
MKNELYKYAFPNEAGVVSVKGGFCAALFTIAIFGLLNQILTVIGPPRIIVHRAKNQEELWKWKNLLLSWIHALIIGIWDLSCFYLYPEMWQDLINHISPFTYYMVAISTGYFFYDFMDLLIQGKLLKEWELSLHHIAVISTFVYNLSNRMFIGYTAVALLTEVNSIFLHLRKLMQMLRVSFTAPVYRLNALINLATFLLCRGYCLARITYGIVAERSRIDTAYLCLLGGAMCIMNLINPALFVILLRSDVFRRSRRLSNTVGHGSDPGADKTDDGENNGKLY